MKGIDAFDLLDCIRDDMILEAEDAYRNGKTGGSASGRDYKPMPPLGIAACVAGAAVIVYLVVLMLVGGGFGNLIAGPGHGGTEPGIQSEREPDTVRDHDVQPEDKAITRTDTPAGNPYAGMTEQDLIDLYFEWYRPGFPALSTGNTPFFYVLDRSTPGVTAFDKRTGGITTLCRVPGCDHKSCAFACVYPGMNHLKNIVASEDRVFFTNYRASGDYALYSCSFDMEDVRLVCTWPANRQPQLLYCANGKLYYPMNIGSGMSPQYVISVLDPDDPSRTETLSVPASDTGLNWLVSGSYIYYMHDSDGTIRRQDLNTGEDTVAVPQSVRRPDAGETGMRLVFVDRDGRICVGIEDQGDERVILYDPETGEGIPAEQGLYCAGSTVFYRLHTVFTYHDDAFYSYYFLTDNGKNGRMNDSGGELWIQPYTGGESERLVCFSTNGVPDYLDIGFEPYGSDGRCVYMRYLDYTGFRNVFNPDYVRPGDDFAYGLMILDLKDMKEYHIGADHDVEWFPDR